MATNSALNLTSLDFDTLKSSLKTYMQSQSIFKDYDFEGSNMNVLMSLLAYNTYINSFYLNMVATESFLDSAQLLDSVISHAKLLNYTPSSYKSPKALIDVTFNVQNDSIQNNFLIPKGAQFSGSNANGAYIYVTDRNYNIVSTNSTFTITGLPVYEGSYINETMIVDNTIENQRFVISNPNIDTDSLQVTVYEDNGATSVDYIIADNLYGLTPNSAVFFLQAYQNQYEMVFGDGVFGRQPQNNATILLTYRITNGTDGGGVSTFFVSQDLGAYNGGFASPIVSINTTADAGANSEGIESIRFRAPKAFQTQGRAITPSDYKTLILDKFPELKTLNVYGGENSALSAGINFGTVYISPITYAGSTLSDNRKQDVITFIKDKMTIGLNPAIVDPDILYIRNNITVTYDPNVTNYTAADIQAIVYNAVSAFNDASLKDFDIAFRFSKFVEAIDAADSSIIANSITPYMKKIASPALFQNSIIDINFHQELVPGSIYSSEFLATDGNKYTFTDYSPFNNTYVQSGYGSNLYVQNTSNILYMKLSDLTKQVYMPIGTIDYINGTIQISSIGVADFLNSTGISIIAKSALDDIFAVGNDLVEFDMQGQNITVVTT